MVVHIKACRWNTCRTHDSHSSFRITRKPVLYTLIPDHREIPRYSTSSLCHTCSGEERHFPHSFNKPPPEQEASLSVNVSPSASRRQSKAAVQVSLTLCFLLANHELIQSTPLDISRLTCAYPNDPMLLSILLGHHHTPLPHTLTYMHLPGQVPSRSIYHRNPLNERGSCGSKLLGFPFPEPITLDGSEEAITFPRSRIAGNITVSR